jgi:hypothetical protein
LALTETGVELYQGLSTPPIFWPLILGLRAMVHALAGDPIRALALIDEAIELGGPEAGAPELRMFRGDFNRLLPKPDLAAAEEAYLAAIRASKSGGQRLVELQALTRLVGLRRDLGLTSDGSDELALLYHSFTEGFAEQPLIMARETLG